MIYSIKQHKEIPVSVKKEVYKTFTRYNVSDLQTSKDIGYVELKDTENGVKVIYMENQAPKLYKRFGMIADQIEVEHCLNRGISRPYIQSDAASGTLLQHFKRGKRYVNESINILLQNILIESKKGERIFTGFLGCQKMYMPMNLINEIMAKIQRKPLLK